MSNLDGEFAFFEETLQRYRDVTLKRLLEIIPSREPRKHLYDLMAIYPRRLGKGLRAALCLATCEAFGGSLKSALSSAVAIELFHNAFLIHDDIQDESLFRRKDATLYANEGIAIAINVGNALNLFSLRLLMENRKILGPYLSWQIFTETEEMLRQTLEGQAMELGWIRDNVCELTDIDYLRMSLKKTSWYTFIYPCRVGALIATAGAITPERFYRFGWYLGLAFQIQDDLLNLLGNYTEYGKEIYGDLLEGKRTLMMIHLLNNCLAREKAKLINFLSLPRKKRSRKDVEWIHKLMVKYDSINYARSCARRFAGASLYEFFNAFNELPNSDNKRFLHEMILYVIERDC
jgi:geranylgeranyl diphosphate synthase, type II